VKKFNAFNVAHVYSVFAAAQRENSSVRWASVLYAQLFYFFHRLHPLCLVSKLIGPCASLFILLSPDISFYQAVALWEQRIKFIKSL
jgi:hypothetical protein